MEKQIFITTVEHEKCRKVADAFAELEDGNIVVADAGRYGFVKLQYFNFPFGFYNVMTFTESEELFENLWHEWLCGQLLLIAIDTPLIELGYDDIFKCLPEQKQAELMDKRIYFAQKAEVTL